MYLVDGQFNPVPVGVTGNLYIGGHGVARGYMRLPDMTAERFLPNPFSTLPGDRLYKTGDLGRYMPSGDIEFLGRSDCQIKIRSFRVEPQEIQAGVRVHPRVPASSVLAP